MLHRKFPNIILSAFMILSLLTGTVQASAMNAQPAKAEGNTAAMPMDPTDETKVPHYFGPWPNWANSPFTLPNATVTIQGAGTGAEAVAVVDPATQGISSIQIISPGTGYAPGSTTVAIAGGNGTATATATVNTTGSITSVNVDVAGAGYTAPQISFTGGGGTGVVVSIGNPLMERTYTTDTATGVFVVLPTSLPNGQLQSFQTLNQASAPASTGPSAGKTFNAYVLRPTGVANEYQVLFDSGPLTVPALANPAVSEVVTFDIADIAVQAGDMMAFYGQGIPLDINTGSDITSYPAPAAPGQGATTTVGDPATFPLYAQARSYSFGAQVLDLSLAAPVTQATGTAYGGVDAVVIADGGWGYTMPTVEFDLPDAADGVTAKAHVASIALGDAFDGMDANGTILPDGIIVDDAGSGYLTAPAVAIHNGTLFDPIALNPGGSPAVASTTLKVTSVTVDTFGSGYVSAPSVTFSDPTGTGAAATASVDVGGVTAITVTNAGTDYLTKGMRKFIDDLPGLCTPPACPTTGKYIPLAVPAAKVYNGIEADEYVIGLVQYRTSFSSDLPPTLVRGYVQLETAANVGISQHFPLTNELLDGTKVPVMLNGVQARAVTPPQWLGPTIAATKNKPVRIVFHNLLPTGEAGDLFLPVDASMMGSGMGPMDMGAPMNHGTVMDEVRNPMCGEPGKGMMQDCFKDNRATLHLHGGTTPWISDGTAHQWTTPAGEMTDWPQGVSVANVPDMGAAGCNAADDGCLTFYYTNQQSARLLFYHDHAWGITRLNVYAGEAAGYLISDETEKKLMAAGGALEGLGLGIPLVVQDRTFVPDAEQLAAQDPTWDTARWGTKGSFWYHHVYMPAQNPGDPSGMSAYGRWMYGPWFWPPAANTVYGPIDNPYYDPTCNLDDPTTWTYQTDPFCEPQQIPGTPNISAGMEQFNDTPIVNGVAYPKVTLEPKSYRFRVLNAANDRFFNFQWYIADPTQGNGKTEVALNPAELAAAQTDTTISPTPVQGLATAGPDWIQIGSEGGFLPAPTVIDGQQPTTWITDPTRFDVGNVDKHSLLLAPAERADVIVDFSKFAGKTLILYNDAPAAFPARVPSYDYYTGAPDMSPNGAPAVLPGYGPNTRTIMQVTIAATTPAAQFNLTRLQTAFKHNANGTGVFESGQHPIIVGQAAYNSAYGTSFAASSNCNVAGSTLQRCDGLVRVNDTMTFGFNTLKAPTVKMTMPLQPKAIHDETNSTTFDEYGRMQANLGVEAQPPTPGQQNVTLYPFVNPATELIDATNLPRADVTYDANGKAVSDIKITPISSATDGTQIWRITHNGVDTHPIHFHLYDVQLVNRVTWDNIIIPTEASELGWKDTVRVSPLEDTIVALRPIIPEIPWELPNAIRMLNPMMPAGSTAMFNNIDPQGNPTAAITNQLVNFGWEYVYHCHILSHEEMDMMRPVSVALPPVKPSGLAATTNVVGSNVTVNLSWSDNSVAETSYVVQRMTNGSGTWVDMGTLISPLNQPNTTGTRTFTDNTGQLNTTYQYQVVAKNTVGYGAEFPTLTVQSVSDPLSVTPVVVGPAAPSNLTATALFNPTQIQLSWRDNSNNENLFQVWRSTNGGAFSQVGTVNRSNNQRTSTGGTVSFTQNVNLGTTYAYYVIAVNTVPNPDQASLHSNTVAVTMPSAPAAPANLAGSAVRINGNNLQDRVTLTWTDLANNETGFEIQRSTSANFNNATTFTVGANVTTFNQNVVRTSNFYYRVRAVNAVGNSGWSNVLFVTTP